MKNTKGSYTRWICGALVWLALMSFLPVGVAVAENSPVPSKKELKTLLATAKTPADQLKIAAYYRDQAQRLKAKATDFAKWEAFYAAQPATIESKQGISCGQCASHYRYFAKLYEQEAKESDALASHYEQLAGVSQR